MRDVLGREIGRELIDLLGLPETTSRFELHVAVDKAVTVKCWYYPEGEGVSRLPLLLQRYRLHADGEPDVVEPLPEGLKPAPADPEFDEVPLLPPSAWDLAMEDGYLLAGIYKIRGARAWRRFELADLPNRLVTPGDLERHGIVLPGGDAQAG